VEASRQILATRGGPSQKVAPEMLRLLALILKLAVSASLLYFALRGVNWAVIAERIHRVDAGWLVAVVAAAQVQVLLGAVRWRTIAAHCSVPMSFIRALRYSYIAAFFSQTLPSTAGGDAARIWLAGRDAGWKNAVYSVLLDRIVGVVALALVVVASLPWTLMLVQDPIGRVALLTIGIGSLCGFAVFLLLGFINWPWLHHWWLARHLISVSIIAGKLIRNGAATSTILAISITAHLVTVGLAWGAAKSVAVPLDALYALLLIPPVILVATVPISIAGWGVRESAMMTAFTYAGLPQTDGLILSVLYGAVMFVTGAAGGVVWILSRDSQKLANGEPDPVAPA
jgi:uncharacterized membrane protein YbhN (UPF0104 family)